MLEEGWKLVVNKAVCSIVRGKIKLISFLTVEILTDSDYRNSDRF